MAMNCSPASPNELLSSRKYSLNQGSFPKRHSGDADVSGRHGNASNDVTGSSSVQTGSLGGSGGTSQPSGVSRENHVINNHSFTQGNLIHCYSLNRSLR